MTSKSDTNNSKDRRLIRSVKVSNPPQCNLGILDLRTNKNSQRLVTRKIPN